jgi:hypothetical protein
MERRRALSHVPRACRDRDGHRMVDGTAGTSASRMVLLPAGDRPELRARGHAGSRARGTVAIFHEWLESGAIGPNLAELVDISLKPESFRCIVIHRVHSASTYERWEARSRPSSGSEYFTASARRKHAMHPPPRPRLCLVVVCSKRPAVHLLLPVVLRTGGT